MNCEVEFSAKNTFTPACLRVGFKCGNMLIISNFNETNGCAWISCLEKNISFWKKPNDSKSIMSSVLPYKVQVLSTN